MTENENIPNLKLIRFDASEIENIFDKYEVLDNKGTISSEQAKEFAEKEFEKFRVEQDKKYISDFDKIIDECKKNN